MSGNIVVKKHTRVPRQDRVGTMIRSAAHLKKPRTIFDHAIRYSREHDDHTLPTEKDGSPNRDRFLWHLDPVALRSVLAQSQTRLRQARPAILKEAADGSMIEIEKAVTAGDLAHLLTTNKLRGSDGKNKPGKSGQWFGDVPTMADEEAAPDGLSNPVIVDLISLAVGAGDEPFAESKAVRDIANMPLKARGTAVAEAKRHYMARLEGQRLLSAAAKREQRKDEKILQLEDDNRTLKQRVEALEDFTKKIDQIDVDQLLDFFGKKPEAA
jgi:hypothetical protein